MTDDHGPGRFRETEIEVPGTPEQVWQAIATEQGHAAWLFPVDIEPAEGGGKMIIHREPFGRDAETTVTDYDPPRRFGFTEPLPGAPSPLSTEILVEARSGGSCIVRVVCGLADVGDEWEDLVDGTLEGWRMSLLMLRTYLGSFAGTPARPIDVITTIDPAPADRETAANALFDALGVAALDRMSGSHFRTAAGAPELAGVVEHASEGYLLLRSDAPYPGLFAISCFPMGVDLPISINLMGRIYASLADDQHAGIRSTWRSWLSDQADSLAEGS